MTLRRIIVALMFCVAAIYALLGYQSVEGKRWSKEAIAPAGAPVISPRRTPELTAAIANDSRTRAAVDRSVGQLPGSSCLEVVQAGRTVVARQPTTLLTPASTAKLFTATTALEVLGPDERFESAVKGPSVDNGVVKGSLGFVGGGDPLLFTGEYQATLATRQDFHTALEVLADKVVAQGVRVVEGGVVGDERRFDDMRAVPSWEPGYTQMGEVGPIGALMVNQGIAPLGGVPQRVAQPAVHAASVLTDLLRARGVQVRGNPSAGEANGREIASVESRPVRDLVAEMLIESDNTTAEVLLKQIGHEKRGPGTTAGGAEVVKKTMQDKGIDASALQLVDGSGLDRSDRATCRTLGDALRKADNNGIVAAGLAKAGESGTLRERMSGTPAQGRVQAKTGTLSGVSGLVGWARPPGNAPTSFSLLLNGIRPEDARAVEDRLAVSLASMQPVASLAAYAPDPLPR